MENKKRSILNYILWVVVVGFVSLEAINKTAPDADLTIKIIMVGSLIIVGTLFYYGRALLEWIQDKMNLNK